LFTDGASLSARQTLYSLGPLHTIDVMDPDPLCQCRFSSYVRRFIRSPSFSRQPAEFLRFLESLLSRQQYDVLLPTHEQVYLLSRFRDALAHRVGLALPEFAALERLQNKAHFSRLLTELELPQPQTVIVQTREELEGHWRFPFYLKLAHSTAGSGVFFIEDAEALRGRVGQLEAKGLFTDSSEVLVQQPARGVLSTGQAVFNRGQMVGMHCFEARRLGVGGMSTARASADHPLVRQHLEKIGEFLSWHGALFLDYFYDRDTARPEYIEANPRIGETVNAMLSGTNLPQLLVEISRGQHPSPAPPGRVGVRTHNLLMILMSIAYEGGGRVALLRELNAYRTGSGTYENGEEEITRLREDRQSRLPRSWITLQLLIWPGLARDIVAKTIENYALPERATEAIKSLPFDLLDDPK
jgi:predicted ATP-grasp superfamily ATP-dependent carboligase